MMQTTKMLTTKAFEQWLGEQANTSVRYRQVEKSELLAEYTALKQVVDSTDFQAKKKELTTICYADTQEGKTMAQYNKLKWTMSVILYNLLKKEAWKDKPEVAQYLALYEQVQAPEFQKANAFWKNKKRWFTTPESEQEKRFNVLAKNADILFFHQHTAEEIEKLESYKPVWVEEFEGTSLSSDWKSGFLYPTNDFPANHSYVAEQQAYVKGQNTQVSGSTLTIQTKKEKTTASAWHPTKGMILHPFAYTSDVWHTAKAVTQTTGVLQAKVTCKGNVKHVICLTKPKAQKALPVLPLQPAKNTAIYTLVWNEKEVITYINNVEINRVANPLAGNELHVLLRSYLPEKQTGTGKLEVDWIRVYTNA